MWRLKNIYAGVLFNYGNNMRYAISMVEDNLDVFLWTEMSFSIDMNIPYFNMLLRFGIGADICLDMITPDLMWSHSWLLSASNTVLRFCDPPVVDVIYSPHLSRPANLKQAADGEPNYIRLFICRPTLLIHRHSNHSTKPPIL